MIGRLARIAMLAAAFAGGSVHGACGADKECDDLTAWSKFTAATLRISDPESGYIASWKMEFDHEKMDILVRTDTNDGRGGVTRGEVAMVGGRIMMSRGLSLPRGAEIDAIDAPVLSMKLAVIVLSRAFPKGPESIPRDARFDRTDKVGIRYATPSAGGYIPAPWKATGKVSREASGTIAFDFSLSFPVEGGAGKKRNQVMAISGSLAKLERPVFSDATSLAGWTTYGVGPQVEKRGDSTILDYGAKSDDGARFTTIKDIRVFIAAENDPGVADATRDFTGF